MMSRPSVSRPRWGLDCGDQSVRPSRPVRPSRKPEDSLKGPKKMFSVSFLVPVDLYIASSDLNNPCQKPGQKYGQHFVPKIPRTGDRNH